MILLKVIRKYFTASIFQLQLNKTMHFLKNFTNEEKMD